MTINIIVSKELDYEDWLLEKQSKISELVNNKEKENQEIEDAYWEKVIEEHKALIETPEYKEYEKAFITGGWVYFKQIIKTKTLKTLTFGMNINPSGTVSKHDWELFKKNNITPLFPGFTKREVKGYWEGNSEPSIELLIACEDNYENNRKLEKIMKAYNKEFNQDCIMKTNADNTVEFYEKR